MKFSVDGWDPGFGSAFEMEELPESSVQVDATIEKSTDDWVPIPPGEVTTPPSGVLFVDGVRRIDARVWIDDAAEDSGEEANRAVAGICASYAAGVVCCCERGAHVTAADVRRGLFSTAASGTHIVTGGGTFTFHRATTSGDLPNALQVALTSLEVTVAVEARRTAAEHGVGEDNLLVVDGPLRGRVHLPRAIGYVKTHNAQYLPPKLNAVVAQLRTSERTPLFMIGTGWDRYSWYLRLPCLPGGPWSGIVRIEAAPTLDQREAVALADMTQQLLGRFASVEYKDGRAPQNLTPIAGLEKDLKHRLGYAPVIYRSLRASAVG